MFLEVVSSERYLGDLGGERQFRTQTCEKGRLQYLHQSKVYQHLNDIALCYYSIRTMIVLRSTQDFKILPSYPIWKEDVEIVHLDSKRGVYLMGPFKRPDLSRFIKGGVYGYRDVRMCTFSGTRGTERTPKGKQCLRWVVTSE